MKKRNYFLFYLLSLATILSAQNPYASLGVEAKTLTLSEGKYQEHFDDKIIVEIGEVLLNTETGKISGFIKKEEIQPDSAAEGTNSSRFLSMDPLARQFPYYTPYQFAGNKPIAAIDLDGSEPEARIYKAATKEGRPVMIIVKAEGNSDEILRMLNEYYVPKGNREITLGENIVNPRPAGESLWLVEEHVYKLDDVYGRGFPNRVVSAYEADRPDINIPETLRSGVTLSRNKKTVIPQQNLSVVLFSYEERITNNPPQTIRERIAADFISFSGTIARQSDPSRGQLTPLFRDYMRTSDFANHINGFLNDPNGRMTLIFHYRDSDFLNITQNRLNRLIEFLDSNYPNSNNGRRITDLKNLNGIGYTSRSIRFDYSIPGGTNRQIIKTSTEQNISIPEREINEKQEIKIN